MYQTTRLSSDSQIQILLCPASGHLCSLGAHFATCLVLSVCLNGVRGQDVAAAFDIVLHKGVTGQSLKGLR